jgi:hypothetical protein
MWNMQFIKKSKFNQFLKPNSIYPFYKNFNLHGGKEKQCWELFNINFFTSLIYQPSNSTLHLFDKK